MEGILSEVSAKQDRLEKRLENWQALILEHLQGLQHLHDAQLNQPQETLHQAVNFLDVSKFDRCVSPVTPCFELEGDDHGSNIDDGMHKQLEPCAPSPYTSQGSHRITVQFDPKVALEPSVPMFSSENQKSPEKNKSSHLTWASDKSLNRLDSLRSEAARIVHKGNLREKSNFGGDRPPPSWRGLSSEEARRISETRRISILTAALSEVADNDEEDIEHSIFSHKVKLAAQKSMRRTVYGSISKKETLFVNVVRHPFFQIACGTIVLLNSVLIGVSVESEANGVNNADDDLEVLSHACSIFFILELVVRITAFGVRPFFLYAEDRWMNVLDTLLVVLSIVDAAMGIVNVAQSSDLSMGRIFKTVRLLRILRIFKIFRFFPELSIMLFMICECLTSLFWAIVLLLIIMYTFAIIFTQSATTYRGKEGMADLGEVEEKFGTVARTTYYLFQSMLGGISWGLVTDTMLKFDKVSTALFFFYIAFTMLAVLNIITGIFVDNALETSRMQRDYIVKREQRAKSKAMKELSKIFDEMDEDDSGTISWDEMATALEDAKTRTYFSALGLNTDDMRQVFDMMDDDDSGQVDLEEFLDGCGRCTGDAKSMDLQALMHDVRRLHKRLDKDGLMEITRIRSTASTVNIPGDNTTSISREVKSILKAWSRSLAAEFKQLKLLSNHIMHMIESSGRTQNHSPITRPESLFAEFTGRSQ